MVIIAREIKILFLIYYKIATHFLNNNHNQSQFGYLKLDDVEFVRSMDKKKVSDDGDSM